MSLVLPPWYFTDCTESLSGTPTELATGTAITAGANNADGTAVSVLSALAHDVHFLVVGIGCFATSTANCVVLLDVLVDPAGGTSWSSFIDDLLGGSTPTTVAIQQYYYFPIYIKAGSSVGARARTAHTSDITAGRVVMWAFGNPSRPDAWWCGNGVESLGINAGSSAGTSITPGASGAAGSWTSIGTSSAPYGAVQFGIQGPSATSTAKGGFWELGISSTVFPAHLHFTSSNTAEAFSRSGTVGPIWCNTPASTTWQMRGTLSGAAEAYNGAVYGVY